MKCPALVLSLLLPAAGRALAGAEAWDPRRTWALVVGVLEYRAESYSPFSKVRRQDAALVEVLRARGVPEDQLVFLEDKEAKRGRIEWALDRILDRTRPGDTLLFLFAGHGGQGDKAGTYFVTWDTDPERPATTALGVPALFDRIEAGFKGERVLLMADSCYSGALSKEAADRTDRSGIRFAALTAALSNVSSTGAWTFTECLVDGFAGAPWVDLDRDGRVTLAELAEHVAADMAFADQQHASFAAAEDFPAGLVLAPDRTPPVPGVGERFEARYLEDWWKARVIGFEGGKPRVHWLGYGADWDEVMDPARLRKVLSLIYPKGSRVEVESDDKWYPARVLRVDRELHLVKYDAYGPEWNEWVGDKRLRPLPAR